MELKNPYNHGHGDTACADLPDLKRLNYFYGQMLGVNDFRTEQAFFREKLKLHNRCLHGYGTVCGLKVVPVPPTQECKSESDLARETLQAELDAVSAELEDACKKNDEPRAEGLQARAEGIRRQLKDCDPPTSARVVVECGLALDCEGNEIIVPQPDAFDPWHLLSEDDRKRVQDGQGTNLYLSICYCEQPVDPVRPVMPNACGATPECSHGKLRDSYKLRLTVDAPPSDKRCEPCCSVCEDACLLLAVLHGYRKGLPATHIDNSVRRLVSTFPATTITGISWTQGATYSSSEASEIIGSPDGTAGIQIKFSRPVLTSTLTDGVVDLWVIEGGRTKHSGVYYLEGEFESFGGAATVEAFRFRYRGDENLDPGDRVMVTIRCAFILDECCRPVDGAHVGGRVPLIDTPEFKKFDQSKPNPYCAVKPPGYGPWTSGAGTPGSSFESWFFIEKAKDGEKRRPSKEYTK